MLNFKKLLLDDLKNVFYNTEEFAAVQTVEYGGKKYEIPVITDYDGAKDRQMPSNDNADGIFTAGVRVRIPLCDLKIVPRKGAKITMGGDRYTVIKVSVDAGEIILDLEEFDE